MALDYDFEASVYVVVFYYVAKAVHYVVMHKSYTKLNARETGLRCQIVQRCLDF